jgi:integrase
MRLKIRHQVVRVRADNRITHGEKFTGSTSYSVVGKVDEIRVRLALGTDIQRTAIKRVEKITTACADGPDSLLWPELQDCLPIRTFKFFADKVGYVRKSTSNPTWKDLTELFELEMKRLIANKLRGATLKEGAMSESTRLRYRQTVKTFTAFVGETTLLTSIKPATIELYKVERLRKIEGMKQSRGGSSVALDIAILHRIFAFAVKRQMMLQKPIDLSNESKPGENPKNGARTLTADELGKLRAAAGEDLFAFLVLRWTGLRCSDAINLTWRHIHFDRGKNGEIEILTQKRGKPAIIPLSPELREALEDTFAKRSKRQKVQPDDIVLCNPEFNQPFSSRHRLYERMKALGIRAAVERVTPHCFRDTFACDMLARGAGIYDVAMMLADTVDTIQKHYAQFVPAARDAAQERMAHGIGIEERARLANTRGKVAVFPGKLG